MKDKKQAQITPVPQIQAIDLFCGAGGLTHGLSKSGVNVRLGVDFDPACEYPYAANNKTTFLLRSVEEMQPREIEPFLDKGAIRLLSGCAPCQTFSTYNQKADLSDKRWGLLLEILRFVRALTPELVTMENVPGLAKQHIFSKFVSGLEKCGYFVSHSIVNCAEYGIPQQRTRLVLVASGLGPVKLLSPGQWGRGAQSVRQSIGGLPPLRAGETDPQDPLHQSSALSEINMRRIKASRAGGTWRDWPPELVANCHRKPTGKTYRGVYGRMTWDDPAPTITTQFYGFGNGRFGHPEQDRAISLREGAILQSFPHWYEFVAPGEKVRQKVVGRLIGNAVPVILGEVIGASLLLHVGASKS